MRIKLFYSFKKTTSCDKRRKFSLIHFGDIGIGPVDKEWRSKREKQDYLYIIVLTIHTRTCTYYLSFLTDA